MVCFFGDRLYYANMITQYIKQQLKKASYKILEDGTFFGEIPGVKGVWANAKNLEDCRRELQEVLEEWILLKLSDGDSIPGLAIPKTKIKQPLTEQYV